MSILASFKSIKSAVTTPMICYSLVVWSFVCVHLWTSELKAKGYFSIRVRYHTSYFEGDGALTTILAMKLIGAFIFLACVYYTISGVKFIREYRETFENKKQLEFENVIKFFKTFEYSKLFSHLKNKIFSCLKDIFSLKFCYIIFWLISVFLIYNYLRLDSIFVFVLMTLPFLIITLFLPITVLDILIYKTDESKKFLKRPSIIKLVIAIIWISFWAIGLSILFTIIDPYMIIVAGIISSPIILLLFLLPLIPLLGSSKKA